MSGGLFPGHGAVPEMAVVGSRHPRSRVLRMTRTSSCAVTLVRREPTSSGDFLQRAGRTMYEGPSRRRMIRWRRGLSNDHRDERRGVDSEIRVQLHNDLAASLERATASRTAGGPVARSESHRCTRIVRGIRWAPPRRGMSGTVATIRTGVAARCTGGQGYFRFLTVQGVWRWKRARRARSEEGASSMARR